MAKNEESVLGKIKLTTGEQMDILNDDFFSQEIESLKRRIEQVECSKTHEEIAKASLKKESKVQKHLQAVLAFGGKPREVRLLRTGIGACLLGH